MHLYNSYKGNTHFFSFLLLSLAFDEWMIELKHIPVHNGIYPMCIWEHKDDVYAFIFQDHLLGLSS